MHTWSVHSNFDEASKSAADFLSDKIELAIKERGHCSVALPGGNSPVVCLGYLANNNLDWEKVHWYMGDERCYPHGHEERNDVMLKNAFWSHLSTTKMTTENIHTIPAELGAEEAAEVYRAEIKSVKSLDIAFLGLGEDGHTASLFPNNNALKDSRTVVPVHNSPKAPDERVSLSLNMLKMAKCRVIIASGNAKAKIISRIKSGETLPVNCIGDINWFTDETTISAVSDLSQGSS